jgi:hypothetical protein
MRQRSSFLNKTLSPQEVLLHQPACGRSDFILMQIELATAPGGTHTPRQNKTVHTPRNNLRAAPPESKLWPLALSHTLERAQSCEQRAKSVSIEILLGLHELNTTEPSVYHNGRLRER